MRFERRPSGWPSSNRGWRLGVVAGASVSLVIATMSVLTILIGVFGG